MNNTVFLSVILLCCLTTQTQASTPRGKYTNFSYVSSKLTYTLDDSSFNNDYGAAITTGRTFYLHKTPLVNMIHIGIDWTYFDLNFSKYSKDYFPDYSNYLEEEMNAKIYQGEVGMHIGPSITVTPVNGLSVSGYFRYAPSFAAMYDDYSEKFSGVYGSFFVSGISVSYKVISLGIEQRWGSAKHKFDVEDADYSTESTSHKQKVKSSGPRFYLGFRF